MKKNLLIVLALAFVLSLVVACSSPTPTPLPPATAASSKAVEAPTATRVPPTATPVPPTATAVPPTPVPPTATTVPPTPVPPTATTVPATATAVPPTATAAPVAAPGLYVADIRVQPASPAFNQNISFFVTFNNADTKPLVFNWKLLIYRADIVTKSDNETSVVNTIFAPGKSEVAALGTYKYGATGRTCEYFFARIVWMDSNNQARQFTTVDGKTLDKGFQICDVATIPTSVPSAAQPASTVAPATTNLFVTGMRLDPAQPAHNQTINLYPTFNNPTNAPQNYMWNVFIYRASTPLNPETDTTAVQSSFAAGSNTEAKAGNSYSFGATGNTCDYFFARVGWKSGDKVYFFAQPDGKIFEKGFAICN